MTTLNEIDIKCLANMPMMLDVISSTTRKLELTFDEIYPKIDTQLTELGLVAEDEWEFGYYPFSLNTPKNKGGFQSLTPEFQILYEKTFNRKDGRNITPFEISYGYIIDEQQNAIYFQLSEESSECINSNIVGQIQQLNDNKWDLGYDIHSRIWLEFKVGDNLTEDKILALSKDFQTLVLDKIFEK